MKKIIYLLLVPVFFTTCTKDSGRRLFDMFYPNTQFTIQAGWGQNVARAFEVDNVQSNIQLYLDDNNLELEDITAIRPVSARIRSLDGFDLDFIRTISIRVCTAGTDNCSEADEVFYIDQIYNRIGGAVDLQPGLRNAIDELTAEDFKLEVVFVFGEITPYTMNCIMDMTFEAVELE